MKLDPELLKQLQEAFVHELDEQVQLITQGLLSFEKGLDKVARQQTLVEIFRAAHNIKGAARGVGSLDVSEIAHRLENLFGLLKRENALPEAIVIDQCLRALDRMRECSAAHIADTAPPFDVAALLAQLDAAGTETPAADKPVPEPTDVGLTAASVTLPAGVATAVSVAPAATLPTTRPAIQAVAPTGADVPGAPHSTDQSAAAKPVAPQMGSEVIRVSIEKLNRLGGLGEELQALKIEMEDHLAMVQRFRNQVSTLVGGLNRSNGSERGGGATVATPIALKSGYDTIGQLDVIANRLHRNMRVSTNRLGVLTGTLQDDVRMMRLVPAATLLRPMARSVRDVARELGKQVEFEIKGDEIEVDRAILDGVKDPLLHLLRNAIDHGIEDPQTRSAMGKSPAGSLRIEVSGEGNQIVLAICDDGLGINEHKILASARNKKLVSDAEAAAMSREEILGLIFRPGFSTKEIITNISGRGVGLDVVASNVRALKGSVHVDAEPGRGTTFTLRLPLTLATDHGLLVCVGDVTAVIPITAVDRVMEISPHEIIEVEASHALRHNGRAVPLRELAAVLQLELPAKSRGRTLPVVVVSKGWDTVALLVDEILGEREIVIKPFSPPLVAVPNITGGALTGSGEVIMVLNPSDLVESALRGSRVRISAAEQLNHPTAPPHILVVDDSITTRTLEKSILEHAGYQVSTAVNGQQAWESLQAGDFDLVVADVEMPVMNGFELTTSIKQDDRYQRLPVIIVTSLARDSDRQRGVAAGADAYIVKGEFETSTLLDVVAQLV